MPTPPEVLDDGKSFKIQVDAKDEKSISNIRTKIIRVREKSGLVIIKFNN